MVKMLGVLAGVLLLLPAMVSAQAGPSSSAATASPHPTFPWALGVAIPHGQLVRYRTNLPGQFVRDIWVAPQPVVLDAMVAMPAQSSVVGAEAPEATPTVDQYGVIRYTFTVPGYHVRQTTVGFHYPERWVLDASYNWRLLPAEFHASPTLFRFNY